MKNFTLKCAAQHTFDGWFQNRESLHKQIEINLVECPYCGSTDVEKMLSVPQLNSPKMRRNPRPEGLAPPAASAEQRLPDNMQAFSDPSAVRPQHVQENLTAMRMMIKHIQNTVESEFKNVGNNFASQARKMHNGEMEAENIYGQCSEEEREELRDDGIDVFALPELPKDN